MKLLNIFKKKVSKTTEVKNIEKMDKKQLEKVVGGAEGDPIPGIDVKLGKTR